MILFQLNNTNGREKSVARSKSIGIRQFMNRCFPPQRLGQIARKSGAFSRQRKIKAVPFFWTLVIGFGAGSELTIAGLRRYYQSLTGTTIVPSAFYDRFTSGLVEFLRMVLGAILESARQARESGAGILSNFVDTLAMDATVIRLHPLLEKAFPSAWTNHTKASAKLEVVMCVKDASLRSVKITEGRRHECRNKKVGPWVSGRLLLFDLGYFKYPLFDAIDRHKGYFVSRLKNNSNPVITKALRQWRGRSIDVVGQRVHDVLPRLKRQTLDAEVEVSFLRRNYRGKRRSTERTFRLVGVLNEETGDHHLYLTNIPNTVLSAEEVARVYQARWQVELMFAELKRHYRLGDLRTRNRNIVEALLYTTLLTMVASRQLLRAIRAKLGNTVKVPELRWASLLAGMSPMILQIIAGRVETARAMASVVERTLIAEAADPNKGRRLLVERVEFGPIAA